MSETSADPMGCLLPPVGPLVTEGESSLILHAKRELTALGYDLNSTEEGPDKRIAEQALELLTVFGNQGHSGSSAPELVSLFSKLALFKPLCPLTGEDSEWNEVGDDVFQNNRCPAVFKNGKDGRPYYLDAIVWVTQNDVTVTGTVSGGTTSFQFLKFPFIPKTFFVDVIERKVSPDNWEYDIKDKAQLDPVFAYYEKP